MRKTVLILVMALLASAAFAGTYSRAIPMENWRVQSLVTTSELDEDTTWWTDDFEGGMDAWDPRDLTASPSMWHVNSFNAYDGNSWWCADPELEGYNDHWLMYLESPELDLTNASDDLALDFMMYLDCEGSAGADDPYDGWDGANVWYSTDGETWNVMEDPSVPYGSESLYGFGSEFGMGAGIPGWDGDLATEWMAVSFDLGDFAGESSFQIRFAFCADPGESTPDGGYLSWFLDDILLSDGGTTYLENDADGTATPSDLVGLDQGGNGDFWELQTTSYHSESHAWHCPVEPEILDALVSPEIEIPSQEEWPATFMTYWVWCNMLDDDGSGDNSLEDYYMIEITDDGGVSWVQVVYDYGYDNGSGDSEAGWVLRTNGLISGGTQTEDIDLTPWAGETVQLRFKARTDDNDDGGAGEGLYIDDVMIHSTTGLEYDIAVLPLDIPFPTSVGYPTSARATYANLGNNEQTFSAFWNFNGVPQVFGTELTLAPDETVTLFMDPDPNDGLDAWVPTTSGANTFFARHLASPDENASNNTTETIEVDVMPEGQYELGYNNRIVDYTTSRFEQGQGPLMYYELPKDLANFDVDSIRCLWNGDFQENEIDSVEITVHFYSDDSNPGIEPGTELYSQNFWINQYLIYSNTCVLNFSTVDALRDLGDFWVWMELIDESAFPHPLWSGPEWGEGHCFEFDGETVTAADADWFIHVVGWADYVEGVVDLGDDALPSAFSLSEAYPNPFNPSTNLRFEVPMSSDLTIAVYNLMGQEVAKLASGRYAAGSYNVTWQAENMASGMYFIRMNANGFNSVRKVMLLK